MNTNVHKLIIDKLSFDKNLSFFSDIGSHNPIYIYINRDKTILYHSLSLKNILSEIKKSHKIEVDYFSLSFLLQNSLIPQPKTIFKNFYIVSGGQNAKINNENNKFKISFNFNFPFHSRFREKTNIPNREKFLRLISDSVSKRKFKNNSLLFHSAGKDSNIIALSLSKYFEDKDKIKLVCGKYSSSTKRDESDISKKLAIKLGFKHQILYEKGKLLQNDIKNLEFFFEECPFPNLDPVKIAYPMYYDQIEFSSSNIIDGLGNDASMGYVGYKNDYYKQILFSKLAFIKKYVKKIDSTGRLNILLSSRSELTGMTGFSFSEAKSFFTSASSTIDFWLKIDKNFNDFDFLDFRGVTRGMITDHELFIRKVRNATDVYSSNLILPFCDENVSEFMRKIPAKLAYDKKNFINKIFFREILLDELGLDSNKIGKLSYEFDFWSIIEKNEIYVKEQIFGCKYWDNKKKLEVLINNLKKKINENNKYLHTAKLLIYKIFMLSIWLNKNKYLN